MREGNGRNPAAGNSFDGVAPWLWRLGPWAHRSMQPGKSLSPSEESLRRRLSSGQVSPGAQHELEYLIFKTETYISHLQTIRAFLGGFIAYDAAFRAKQKKDEKQMLDQFDMCEFLFSETRDQVLKTVKQLAASAFVEDPTEKYLLFRYNVRFVLPIEQFGKFIKNVVNFHHGQPYWERVDWGLIAPCRTGDRPCDARLRREV